MRILVVEDEKDLRNIIKKRLVREHYSVDVCGDRWGMIHQFSY